jgi:hypothetical protein
MLKGLMNIHNARQHQDISLWRRVAPLRHQHSDNDFNDSDHCAKINIGPPQKQTSDGPQPTQSTMMLPQQKLDCIHHNLKEEPSALRSLSIFDSTETEHKMHNGRRPVVEIAICM